MKKNKLLISLIMSLLCISLQLKAEAVTFNNDSGIHWEGWNTYKVDKIIIDLNHTESIALENAKGAEDVAIILSSVILTPIVAPLAYGTIYAIKDQVKDKDKGNGTRITYYYETAPIPYRHVGVSVDSL